MADHVDLMREAARVYRNGHTPTDADRRRIAELLEGAAAREESYRTREPRADPPGAGDEAWLARQFALAFLGRQEEASGG